MFQLGDPAKLPSGNVVSRYPVKGASFHTTQADVSSSMDGSQSQDAIH